MYTAPRKNEKQPQPQNFPVIYESSDKDQESLNGVIVLTKDEFSVDLKYLDEKVNSIIGRSENLVKLSEGKMIRGYVCHMCGKEGQGNNIRLHIETNHLEGISIPCNICGHSLRSRTALKQHKAKHHTNTSG